MSLLYLFLLLIKPVLSQEATPVSALKLYQQYKSDYLYQYNIYQTHLNQFTEKKQIDTAYKSISTQKEKNEAFVNAFKSRSLSLETYCRALRVKLDTNKPHNPDNTQQIQDELKNHEKYLLKINQDISRIDISNDKSLSDLDETFQEKFQNEIKKTIHTALVENSINYNLALIASINNISKIITQENENKPEILHIIKVINNKAKNFGNETVDSSMLKMDEFNISSPNSYNTSMEENVDINNNIFGLITELKAVIKQ